MLNIDQRNRDLQQFVYKRDVVDEADAAMSMSTILHQVYKNSQPIVPFEYILESDYCTLLGSDMRATNLRLFADIIPENYHNKILNQYIVGNDSKYLVFADNATTRIYLPNLPFNE